MPNAPIYFDELSLCKFIEDYLDYQIDYAHSELSKISGDSRDDSVKHSHTGVNSNNKNPIQEEIPDAKENAYRSNTSAQNSLAANFLIKVSGEGDLGTQAQAAQDKADAAANQNMTPPRTLSNKSKKPELHVINELIMMLEVDRLIFKSFNTLVAISIKQEHKKISDFLQESRKE